MLELLKEKRAECLDNIKECEKELERAKIKLELLDEIIRDSEEDETEEKKTEETAETQYNGY